jgi:DNA-binding MarR family transcriptional regulator
MSSISFHRAYLGKRLQDLLDLAHLQMGQVYKDRALRIPVQGSSTLQVLRPDTRQSLSDLARALGQSHQLVAKRIKRLLSEGLVTALPDPADGRRTLYELTSSGEDQWHRLDAIMSEADHVNAELFNEIGVDLIAALDDALEKLNERGLDERFKPEFHLPKNLEKSGLLK